MMNVKRFMIDSGLHESCYDFEAYALDFAAEMEAGLSGRKSSLRMLPSFLNVSALAPPEGDAIAVDAGGTNLRIARVCFAPGAAPKVLDLEKRPIPGAGTWIEKDEFFERIADYIGDRIRYTNKIGFCFSFPCEILPNRDGKIIKFDKELRVRGSDGALIGVELNAAFARAGRPAADVTVLNDTSGALLGMVFAEGAHDMGGYIGLIFGTGANICYYDAELGMLVNTEAGGYGNFAQTSCDREIDMESEDPGEQRFEKMVSGAYFSTVCLKAARLAAREGVFCAAAAVKLAGLDRLSAETIDAFMRGMDRLMSARSEDASAAGAEDVEIIKPDGTGSVIFEIEGVDAMRLYEIFDGLYERAAKLLAIAMTAVLRRCGASADRPALIVAEGSGFCKGYRFRERFEKYMAAHAQSANAYELRLADDHVAVGAAASVFL